jgi:alkanesulfonate monooxygenase SsuD/methylene tetrahydromethanopterin reductase-like flavin-dependent oxidoreductase (luciferase family)
MITSQGQVIMLLVVLAAGFIIGAALAWWLASRGNTPPADQEQELLKELRKKYIEKAGLWQDRSSGQLAVRSGGQLITSVQQMTEAQKRNMNSLLKDWAGWMGFISSQVGAKADSPEMQPAPIPQTPETAASFAAPNLEEAVEGKGAGKALPEKPKSIVEQINDILQDNLKTHPALTKGIRLTEDPREGVIVWVGLEHYAGVDAVTDPEVKEVLKAAVMEWERRTQPGK